MAYHECDCPYHYDEYGCQGPGECDNEGTIKVPRFGWLCPSCYDGIDDALKTINYRDLTVLDADGNVIVQGKEDRK
jgi:hypothetical protein